MLRTVIPEFAKALPGKTNQIPLTDEFKGMMYDQIEAALVFGARKLAWLSTISGTLSQQMAMERVCFCGYIGHSPSGLLNRLALFHNPAFYHSYQL
jgi:hypothetical protein